MTPGLVSVGGSTIEKLSNDTTQMENYAALFESHAKKSTSLSQEHQDTSACSDETKSTDDDDMFGSSSAADYPYSGAKLSLSDFQTTPSRHEQQRSNHHSDLKRATFGNFRSSERTEMLSLNSNPKKTTNVLDSKEQLKRVREKREQRRFASLRSEAFYNASHGMTVLPARLDFQQAKQLLASKRK